MKIQILSDGRVLEGTAQEIVEAMKYVAFDQEGRSLGEYIDWALEEARRLHSLELVVEGEGDEERAEGLVRVMLEMGLAVRFVASPHARAKFF